MSENIAGQSAEVIVVGAGASGLMAAISAAERGASVLALDRQSVCGKKILSTGNGRCNFTNARMPADCYRSDAPQLADIILEQFNWRETVIFFERLGICTKSKDGYYYPRSMQASAIRDALLSEARRLRVMFRNKVEISEIRFRDGLFEILTDSGVFSAKKCILATGGSAAPKTGSDGSGYRYARQLGHTVLDPLPALVPLVCDAEWLRQTAGVRCDARVTIFVDGERALEDSGEVQFTDYGISGIPVFQVSRYASVALAERRKVEAVIDFVPEYTSSVLSQEISRFSRVHDSYKNWKLTLCGLVNKKVAEMVCATLGLGDAPISQMSEQDFQSRLSAVTQSLKETRLPVLETRSMDQAQVTCGGVPLKEIDADLQSVIMPGLYFAGEILNVDGICGGYNLQWAWCSGFLAGVYATQPDYGARKFVGRIWRPV